MAVKGDNILLLHPVDRYSARCSLLMSKKGATMCLRDVRSERMVLGVQKPQRQKQRLRIFSLARAGPLLGAERAGPRFF